MVDADICVYYFYSIETDRHYKNQKGENKLLQAREGQSMERIVTEEVSLTIKVVQASGLSTLELYREQEFIGIADLNEAEHEALLMVATGSINARELGYIR